MKKIQRIAQAVAVGSAVAVGAPAQQWLNDADVAITLQLVVMGALIASCLTVWREVVETRVLGLKWLRRLILAREYVEGHWIDVVMRPAAKSGDPINTYIGIVTFEPSGSDLRYRGDNFMADGSPLGTFNGRVVELEMPELVFTYGEDRTTTEEVGLLGIGHISFITAPSGPPQSYRGRCLDDGNLVRHTLIGRRLTADEVESLPLAGPRRGARAVELAADLFAEPAATTSTE